MCGSKSCRNGWTICKDSEELDLYWMKNEAAPNAVLECVSCKCKKCSTAHCSCKVNKLCCTGACSCDVDECENKPAMSTNEDDLLLSDDDSDKWTI